MLDSSSGRRWISIFVVMAVDTGCRVVTEQWIVTKKDYRKRGDVATVWWVSHSLLDDLDDLVHLGTDVVRLRIAC